jgi:hypothetical protein
VLSSGSLFSGRPEGGLATASSQDVTQLLHAWGQGDEAALEKLVPLVYRELRQRAHRYMGRERRGHSLQTTALINEAYLRLVGGSALREMKRSETAGPPISEKA